MFHIHYAPCFSMCQYGNISLHSILIELYKFSEFVLSFGPDITSLFKQKLLH